MLVVMLLTILSILIIINNIHNLSHSDCTFLLKLLYRMVQT